MEDEQAADKDEDDLLGLDNFSQPDDDGGLSLESLSAAYAELLDQGSVPYEAPPEPTQESDAPETAQEEEEEERDCGLSPRSILEAMLFVGNAENEPLTSKRVAGLMRGVRPREIDELVVELNESYEELGCPYRVVTAGGGYQLQLCGAYAGLRDKFYRRVKDAKLSQSAIDVLAIVAYRQPIKRDQVDQLRGRPSGAMLSQLVRRQLLRIERPEGSPRRPEYYTTDRFLQLFGLDSLGELPQSQDIDRDF